MGSSLTSRERVLMALRHEAPERTPCDFWAEPPAWNRLGEYLGHQDKEQLLKFLEVDVRHLEAPSPAELPVGDGLFQNFWGERYYYQNTAWGPMREDVKGGLAEAHSFAELEGFAWPEPNCIDRTGLREQCKRHQDYALIYGFADVWQRPALVRGWENFFADLVEHPEWVHFLCRKFTDFYLEDYTRAAEVTNGRIDLYLLISDLGSQHGPLISMAMFREFVAPYLKEMIDCIHGLGGQVLFHSCGMIQPFIPELIRLGVDVLDPIQPIGLEMGPENLKAVYGKQLSFHGGIDMQRLLPHGTPEQVGAAAARYSEVLGQGGGYILGPAHLFQPDVPPENIVALYRANRGPKASA
ncbi:MAG TPA: uroporphyrinogen decarboxylase family protein [Candidatus Sulfotelmatobacter sp.]|nr:uroporphyrinogen decarboxylase family protein [Candidatus Sulfotelmatobacter sp.]